MSNDAAKRSLPSHSLEYLARRSELVTRKRKRAEEREKELGEKRRRRSGEARRELVAVRGALGRALKAWGRQLKV